MPHKTEKTIYRSKIIDFLSKNQGASLYETVKAVSLAPHGYLWTEIYSSRAKSDLQNMIKDGIVQVTNSSLYLCGDAKAENQ